MRLQQLGLFIAVYALACGGGATLPLKTPAPGTDGETQATPEPVPPGGFTAERMAGPLGPASGLQFELRAVKSSQVPATEQIRNVAGTKVPDAEADRLLASLPALPKDEAIDATFAKRPASLPPPTAVAVTFPKFPAAVTPKQPPKPAPQPLQVLRIEPTGDVELAPELTVTFNQPMVALTSHADSVAAGVPVTLTPQPQGKWRWLGTRTLAFTPEGRLPMATEYAVRIAKGVRAADGTTLAAQVDHAFRTPPPSLREVSVHTDYGPTSLTPAVVALFDQRVQGAALIAQTRFCFGGKQCIAARAATPQEVAADQRGNALWQQIQGQELSARAIAFTPVSPLPYDRSIDVRFGKVPSAEGPRLGSALTATFTTHGPLRVVGVQCGYESKCAPDDAWSVELTNPLRDDSIDLAAFHVEPAAELISASSGGGGTIYMEVRTRARTRYKLTVPAGIRDIFGQVLKAPVQLEVAVGDPRPNIQGIETMSVLEPRGPRTLQLSSIGVDAFRVRVQRATLQDFGDFVDYLQQDPLHTKRLPGKPAIDTKLKLSDTLNNVTSAIDLSSVLQGGLGQAVVVVEPVHWPDPYKPVQRTWVQSTQLGLDVFRDDTSLYFWVTRLADGKPVAGANVAIEPTGVHGTTDADGYAKLALPAQAGSAVRIATARVGDDLTFYPERFWSNTEPSDWTKRTPGEELRWFVFDDRGAYRPGESVRFKGWLRQTQGGQGGKLVLPKLAQVSYVVTSSRGHELARGNAVLSAAGGFDFGVTLPREVDLGQANLVLTAQLGGQPQEYGRNFLIEEFRRPEYEVKLVTSEATHFVGDTIALRTEARYYTGGGLAGAATQLQVSAARAQFSPPNHGDYSFGEPIWWLWDFRGHGGGYEVEYPARELSSVTDAQGNAAFEVLTSRADPAYPHTLQVSTAVQDVNRQAWSDSTSLLVHPADTYVGVRLARAFISVGDALDADVITVDLDGKDAVGRKVELRGFRREEQVTQGKRTEVERDVQSCTFTSGAGAHRCTFRPQSAGGYELIARVYDAKGRPNETRVATWVTGPASAGPSTLQGGQVQLIPDRQEYQPGQTAEVLLLAPFAPSSALVLVERGGVLKSEHVSMTAASHTLHIPIEAWHAPSLNLEVVLTGADDKGRPRFAMGQVGLIISLTEKRLEVQAKAAAPELEPGTSTQVDVAVRGHDGKPAVGAEVAVVVVDEAVLALTDYTVGDPVTAFYPGVYANVDSLHTRQFVQLRDMTRQETLGRNGGAVRGERHMKAKSAGMQLESADSGGGFYAESEKTLRTAAASVAPRAPGQGPSPKLRKQLSPIALFAPKLVTDAQGRAHVALKLPDDLTRYRIFAVASGSEGRFGEGEGTLTARKQLMVRPSAPRFLNFGDQVELPIVIENQSDRAQSVLVAARAANVTFTQGRGRRVDVPAHDRVELRLPLTTRAPGRALLQVAAQAKSGADAAQVELPVWTPATDEAFATYGSLAEQDTAAQPLAVPSDIWTEFGGLEISTSSTQVAALTDALLYVNDYPFDCSEQIASRIITLLALRDVLAAFHVKGVPTPEEAEQNVKAGVKRLLELQNEDGGFPFWEKGRESIAYNTLHALHALVRARSAGITGLDPALTRARDGVPGLIADEQVSAEGRRMLFAYLAYTDMLRGGDVGAAVEKLWREAKPSQQGVEATGFMLSALSKAPSKAALAREMVAALQARASETASTAQFTERYEDTNHVLLHSEQRSDAIALEGLVRMAPQHDLVPKVAKGLLADRKRGRWQNTQENVFSALALRAYFDAYERETPSFEARAFLGSILAQSARYEGRTTAQATTLVPMAFLAQKERGPLVLQKVGKGRMYYRLGLRYAPKSLWLQPDDQGFEVERMYEGADDPNDVSRDANGVWQVKAGARVRVHVSMVAKATRYHVALVDPLPAGFEPIQSSLSVFAGQPDQPRPCPHCARPLRAKISWWGPWYEHENLRDERAEAFSSLVSAGVYTHSYLARATTPGDFVVPPAKAEEMYMPETFGRSGSDHVVVR